MVIESLPLPITQGSESSAEVCGPLEKRPCKGETCLSCLGAFPETLKNHWGFVIPAVLSHPVLMLLAASLPQPCPWPQEGKKRIAGSILN